MKPFFISLILAFLLFAGPTYAWLDCPYGRINDPYPGQCGLYIDTNNNQICDHSEAPPKDIRSGSSVVSSQNSRSLFIFLTIAIVTLATWFLTKKFLRPLQFRLFWNLVLLATFLPVGVSGILLFLNMQIPNFKFWHNQLGIIFVIVGLLHLLARLNYFKQALGNKIKTNQKAANLS